MNYLKTERKHILYSIILGFTGSLVGISIFGLSGYMISLSFFEPPVFIIILIIAVIKMFGMIKGAFKYFERLLSHDATFQMIGRLRLKYFKDTIQTDTSTHSVRFVQMLNQYFEQIEDYYIRIIYPYVTAVLVALLLTVLSVIVSVPLSIVMLIVSVCSLYILPKLFEKRLYHINQNALHHESSAYLKIYHHIHNYIDLFVTKNVHESQQSVNEALEDIQNDRIKKSGVESLLLFFSGLVQAAGIIAVILLISGEEGLLVPMILLLLIGFFDIANPVILPRTNYKSVSGAVKDITAEKELPEKNTVQNRIVLKNVNYKYPGTKKDAVNNINLTVNQGEKHALIGSSGSGKTTILNQMTGITSSGVMPQHLDFYNASVRDNVTMFGRFNQTDEAVDNALEYVEMEYLSPDEIIDYTGHLSGGERKRLHLVRMILEGKDWWLLDEPTASLNEQLREKVWDSIFMRKTVVVSTHDLTRLVRFDYIHFVEEGHIVESGSYEELLQKRGRTYQALTRSADNLW